jgi:hypothetical protein
MRSSQGEVKPLRNASAAHASPGADRRNVYSRPLKRLRTRASVVLLLRSLQALGHHGLLARGLLRSRGLLQRWRTGSRDDRGDCGSRRDDGADNERADNGGDNDRDGSAPDHGFRAAVDAGDERAPATDDPRFPPNEGLHEFDDGQAREDLLHVSPLAPTCGGSRPLSSGRPHRGARVPAAGTCREQDGRSGADRLRRDRFAGGGRTGTTSSSNARWRVRGMRSTPSPRRVRARGRSSRI